MFDSYNVKYKVDYCLDSNVRNEIIKARNTCMSKFKNAEILLFGSIAKGQYKNSSDIDILILIDDNKSVGELRKLRHEIEDDIDDLNLTRNVDIKLYNKSRYIELSNEASFEQAIIKDLVNIRGWNCG